ncbi:MAG: DNA ligase (NAD(+)) LigA, partial [Planctomycetota bacterium]
MQAMEKDELEKARKRAEELRREIERHNRLYYEEARPEIPDDRYDALVRELRELEERFPSLRTPDSPTRRVGGRPAGRFPTVRHEVPMLSLDNTYNEDELIAFDERVTRLLGTNDHPYVVEPKVDGVALTLLYRNGELEYAATRGDGRTGDVITENALRVKGVPRRLRPPF